jgi:phosphoribosylformimino-5-aminoimidazole carboxamide ribotide isomerase
LNTTSDFTLFPAIDLRGGKVVRLAQGDPGRQTVYGDDPYATACRWRDEGAAWCHVVNLDGAFGESTSANERALESILRSGLKVQFGGGIRDAASLERVLRRGISRVVIGTAAVENPLFIEVAIRMYGYDQIAAGIDARAGRVRTRGWGKIAALGAIALGKKMHALGVRWCIFTDVDRDGVLTGVNIPAAAALAKKTRLRVIASGGAASLDDVRQTAAGGLRGLIIGRALYEGTFTLKDALAVAGKRRGEP